MLKEQSCDQVDRLVRLESEDSPESDRRARVENRLGWTTGHVHRLDSLCVHGDGGTVVVSRPVLLNNEG